MLVTRLTAERNAAVKALQKFCDESTPQPFFTQELVTDGEGSGDGPSFRSRYIHGRRVMQWWRAEEEKKNVTGVCFDRLFLDMDGDFTFGTVEGNNYVIPTKCNRRWYPSELGAE